MPGAIVIRNAELTDTPALRELAELTFRDTYAAFNTEADMDNHCSTYFSPEAMHAELSDAGFRYYLAFSNDDLLGYIKIQPKQPGTDTAALYPLNIARIYVHPAAKGKGIGKALVLESERFCRENSHDLLWLGVWKQNHDAIAFYHRMGFEIIGTEIFVLGNDPQEDWVMAKQFDNSGQV